LFRGHAFNLAAARSRLEQEARRLGLPYGDRQMTYNSRKAQELGKWAETRGKGAAFHTSVFQAYFVHGRNIALPATLMSICDDIGLAADAAAEALDDPSYAAAVDRDWQRSRTEAVTAAPTFMAGGRRLVGAHPYAAIEKLVVAAGAEKRPPAE
jgi:predicted DsbA family dithiol-disulfide isomerase